MIFTIVECLGGKGGVINTMLTLSVFTIVHRPLETSQAPRPHRLEWRFPEPAKETTWRCDPEQVHKLRNKRAL